MSALSLATTLGLFAKAAALADPQATWTPGHRTTSELPGEVQLQNGSYSDGVYGRFDGELALTAAAGALLDWAPAEPRFSAELGLHYLYSFGLSINYSYPFVEPAADRPENLLMAGLDVRPLFLPRWALDLEQGPARLDLIVDSLSVGFGGYIAATDQRSFGDERGLWVSAGLGVPFLPRAAGPWLILRGLHRFAGAGDASTSMLLAVSWQTLLDF